MAHPHQSHKDHHVSKERVKHITRAYASGGAVHPDEKQDKKLVRKMVKKKALKVEGGDVHQRQDRPGRKRGGRAPKAGKTVVNVINTGGGHPQPGVAGMMPPGMPPAPPPAPPGPPAGGMPPGTPPMGAKPPMGAPGLPPGMMARKKGGRVTTTQKGTPVFEEGVRSGTPISHDPGKNDLKDMNRKRVVTFKSGGKVVSFRAAGGRVEAPQGVEKASKLPGGAGGGEGRLAKAHRAERK